MRSTSNGGLEARDAQLLTRLEPLYVAAVSDCLDRIGIRDNVMAPRIRPLARGMRVAGFAATVLAVEVDAVPDDPYAGEIRAVDSQQPGDVMVVSTCNGSYWGELLATSSRRHGAVGIVADCYTRDTRALIEMNYPTFVAAISAQDSLGRIDVEDVRCDIVCGGVSVSNRDLILADDDGVVVIPSAVAEEVIGLAEEKVATENLVRANLADGMTVREVFSAYGIL